VCVCVCVFREQESRRAGQDASAPCSLRRKTRFVEGLSFPFHVWTYITVPRWAFLSEKGQLEQLPAAMKCEDLYSAVHASGCRYFAKISRLQDKVSRDGIFSELDALLRLRTMLQKRREEARTVHVLREEVAYHHLFVAVLSVSIDLSRRPPRLVLLFEAQDTNLAQLLSLNAKHTITEAALATVVHKILLCLEVVHEAGLIHSALDASSVYISLTGRIRLGNFHRCCFTDNATCRGKVSLMPPERLCGVENSQKSDVWSLGLMMLMSLVPDGAPFGDPDLLSYKEAICSIGGETEETDSRWGGRLGATSMLAADGPFSAALRNFIQRCLERNPQRRPSVAECVDMPFGSKSLERSLRGTSGGHTSSSQQSSSRVNWLPAKNQHAILAAWVSSVLESISGGGQAVAAAELHARTPHLNCGNWRSNAAFRVAVNIKPLYRRLLQSASHQEASAPSPASHSPRKAAALSPRQCRGALTQTAQTQPRSPPRDSRPDSALEHNTHTQGLYNETVTRCPVETHMKRIKSAGFSSKAQE
jgi:serine/threonine protein kinase